MGETISDVALALEIIRNATDEQLQPYHREVEQVLSRLGSLAFVHPADYTPASPNGGLSSPSYSTDDHLSVSTLQGTETSTSIDSNESNFDDLSMSCTPEPSGTREGTQENERTTLNSKAVLLLNAMKDQLDTIAPFLQKDPPQAVSGELTWQDEEPRVNDLLVHQGDPRPSSQVAFRRLLSQRSLAKEFLQWEFEKYRKSRLQELINSLDSSGSRGHLTDYVRSKADFVRKEAAHQGIRHGIKLLVIENLTGMDGISALLGFVARRCWALPYPEIRELLELFQKPDFQEIRNLAWQSSSWLGQCQRLYDDGPSPKLQGVQLPYSHHDPIMNNPRIDVYGYLDHPLSQISAIDHLADPNNTPHLDAHGYLEQPLPQILGCDVFAGQVNNPQLDAYGYFEHPLPQNLGRNSFAGGTNAPQLNVYQHFGQCISPRVECAQCQFVDSRLGLDSDLRTGMDDRVDDYVQRHFRNLPLRSPGYNQFLDRLVPQYENNQSIGLHEQNAHTASVA